MSTRDDEREQVALDTAGLRAVTVDEALTDLCAKVEEIAAWYSTFAPDLRAKVEHMAAQDLGPATTPTQVGYDAGRAGAFADVLALLPHVEAAAVIGAVDPIIRADLRANVEALPIVNMAVAIGEWDGQPVVPLSNVLALFVDERADLRAKVKALEVAVVDLDPDPHGRPIERRVVLLSDVLALLPEVSE